MYFFYFDESGNPGKTKLYSAVGIPSDQWLASLNSLIELRKEFKRDYGIDPRKEIHANKLLTGHGNYSQTHKLTEGESLEIVKKMFLRVLGFKGVKILNAAGPDSKAMVTLEYLLNRINHLADSENQDAKLFFDEGNEKKIRSLVRKMRRFNPVPSALPAGWGASEMFNSSSGHSYKNAPTLRILEDPDFRDSSDSYFIQLADVIAYSLYKKEEPTEKFRRNGFHQYFAYLSPVLVKKACKNDPFGIVRT